MQKTLSCAMSHTWSRFISVWELLKESFENYRTPSHKVTTGHQAAHEALQSNKKPMFSALKSDTRLRIRLVEPKSF